MLPLTKAAFKPGNAEAAVAGFQDSDTREIARAELLYYKGDARSCNGIAKKHLDNPKLDIRLSACLMFMFSSMASGDVQNAKRGLGIIKSCSEEACAASEDDSGRALCAFANYAGSILLHLPMDDMPDAKHTIRQLPYEIRICAAYVVAHTLYLQGKYGQALGICQGALIFCREERPIIMTYLECMIAVCEMNLKHVGLARESLLRAWDRASKDDFIEPFVEHHWLLQGLMEACVKEADPKGWALLSKALAAFNKGWSAVHNDMTGNMVSDQLLPMEFSIAMLACKGWSNQEIGNHLGISLNTVKHYLTEIYAKLGIKKRGELTGFVLK